MYNESLLKEVPTTQKKIFDDSIHILWQVMMELNIQVL